MKYQKQAQGLFCERIGSKIFYKSYLFIKVFSNIKPFKNKPIKEAISSKAAHVFLAALLNK